MSSHSEMESLFLLGLSHCPRPLAKASITVTHQSLQIGHDSLRKQLLALGKKGKPPDQRRTKERPVGSPVLGLERKKGSNGSKAWEINPFASQAVSIFCLQQNCRRAQSSCQLIEINLNFFNLYYAKWKHTQKQRNWFNNPVATFTYHPVATTTKFLMMDYY